MAHHKRKRPKHQRNGCLMCKPHKSKRTSKKKIKIKQVLNGSYKKPKSKFISDSKTISNSLYCYQHNSRNRVFVSR